MLRPHTHGLDAWCAPEPFEYLRAERRARGRGATGVGSDTRRVHPRVSPGSRGTSEACVLARGPDAKKLQACSWTLFASGQMRTRQASGTHLRVSSCAHKVLLGEQSVRHVLTTYLHLLLTARQSRYSPLRRAQPSTMSEEVVEPKDRGEHPSTQCDSTKLTG